MSDSNATTTGRRDRQGTGNREQLQHQRLLQRSPNKVNPLDDPLGIEAHFINYGRTPAFINSECIDIFIGDVLPRTPDYSRRAHDLNPILVIKGSEYHFQEPIKQESLTDSVKAEISAMRNTLWVFGYISYSDFLDYRHMLRFCARLSFHKIYDPRKLEDDVSPVFILDGPAAYTQGF
jgi:hypothetical protein